MMITAELAHIDWTWIGLAVSAWCVLSVPLGMAVGRAFASSSSRPQPYLVSERHVGPRHIGAKQSIPDSFAG